MYSNALPIKNIKIRYNEIYSNRTAGINIRVGPSSDVNIFENLIYKNELYGINFDNQLTGTLSYNIFNNTFYSNQRSEIMIRNANASFKALNIINNIFSSSPNTTCLSDLKNVVTEHSNNLFYRQGSNGSLVNIRDKGYYSNTIKNWESSAIVGSPRFIDVSKNDFSLSKGSSAINRGTDLSGTLEDGLNSESVWPNEVKTTKWGGKAGWDIGAFVYGESNLINLVPPKSLRVLLN
jgi:hypothetical protein